MMVAVAAPAAAEFGEQVLEEPGLAKALGPPQARGDARIFEVGQGVFLRALAGYVPGGVVARIGALEGDGRRWGSEGLCCGSGRRGRPCCG